MKDIYGYEGLYAVTKHGHIWSYPKEWARTHHSGKFLKTFLVGHGYEVVSLYDAPYSSKKFLVHRLVAQTYIPNPKRYKEVNHKNANRLDNRVSNLEWCTSAMNKKHAWKKGLYEAIRVRDCKGEASGRSKLKNEDIHAIRRMYAHGFNFRQISDRFSVTPESISNIVRGKTWNHIVV